MWFTLVFPLVWLGFAMLLRRSTRLNDTDKGVIALIMIIGAAIMAVLQIRSGFAGL